MSILSKVFGIRSQQVVLTTYDPEARPNKTNEYFKTLLKEGKLKTARASAATIRKLGSAISCVNSWRRNLSAFVKSHIRPFHDGRGRKIEQIRRSL